MNRRRERMTRWRRQKLNKKTSGEEARRLQLTMRRIKMKKKEGKEGGGK